MNAGTSWNQQTEVWNRDGDFYFAQADQTEGFERARLLQRARDLYLKGGATGEARCVERALDRMRLAI